MNIILFIIYTLLISLYITCTSFLGGKHATDDGFVVVSHSDDADGQSDPRVVYIPPSDWPIGSLRPILPDNEEYPREISYRTKAYEPTEQYNILTVPIGSIPQVSHTYGYLDSNYAVQNEYGVAFGESSCSAIYYARAINNGGEALLSANELTRIAAERCKTARCAVKLMGKLAEEYGFYGASPTSYDEGGETIIVGDHHEGFVMHIIPHPDKVSALWVAQRVKDHHVTGVYNTFTIRDIDFHDHKHFLFNDELIQVALTKKLWNKEDPFDFAGIFSLGEYSNKYYSGRRTWHAFKTFDPTLKIKETYKDFIKSRPYPWSIKPKHKITKQMIFDLHRDVFVGTEFDLTKNSGGGAFGDPNRFSVSDEDNKIVGAWERSFHQARTFMTWVNTLKSDDQQSKHNIVYYSMHSPLTSVFTPLFVSDTLPQNFEYTSPYEYDLNTLFWNFRSILHISRVRFDKCYPYIREKQLLWEERGEKIVKYLQKSNRPKSVKDVETIINKMTELQPMKTLDDLYVWYLLEDYNLKLMNDWWTLSSKLIFLFSDNVDLRPSNSDNGHVQGEDMGYPVDSLKHNTEYIMGPKVIPPRLADDN